MNNGPALRVTREQITDAAVRETGGFLVVPGTVLLSFKLSIGKVGIAAVPMFTNEAIAALPIRTPDRLDVRYLAHALRTLDLAAGANRAAMGKTLNKAALAALRIPLPPVDEQRRIAHILDRAASVTSSSHRSAALLDELSVSAFAEGVRAEDDAQPALVQDLVDHDRGGIRTGPFGSQLLHSEFVDSGVPVLGIDNAVANQFRWGERRFISEVKYAELRRYTVNPGDVLITIMGTCGRVAVVPDDIGVAINTKHLCCITLDQQRCLPEFLQAYFLHHPGAQRYLRARAKGAIMDGLNMGIIMALPVTLPPISAQVELTRKLAEVDAARERTRARDGALGSLSAAFAQRAFAGEL